MKLCWWDDHGSKNERKDGRSVFRFRAGCWIGRG